jgi:hypothetical protein
MDSTAFQANLSVQHRGANVQASGQKVSLFRAIAIEKMRENNSSPQYPVVARASA